MEYTVRELSKIIIKHKKWRSGKSDGVRAHLSGADLSGAHLSRANLSRANLSGAYLSGANLSGADLSGADLSGAHLSRANLSRADLSGADLYGAYLSRADLSGADLSGANLSGANLSGARLSGAHLSRANLSRADLSGADLSGADLSGAINASTAFAMTSIIPQGDIIGWKKCCTEDGAHCIVKLKIPMDAKRSNASGRKCRAEWAEVLEVIGATVGISSHDASIKYAAGEKVIPSSWDDDRWNECSSGIHFFITREEAEAYIL